MTGRKSFDTEKGGSQAGENTNKKLVSTHTPERYIECIKAVRLLELKFASLIQLPMNGMEKVVLLKLATQ